MKRLTKIFIGPGGLRTGWRLLAFLSLFVASGSVLIMALGLIGPGLGLHLSCGEIADPVCFLAQNVIGCLALAVAGGLMVRIERRPRGSFGLPLRRGAGLRLGEGILWGLVASGLTYALLAAEGHLHFQGMALNSDAVAEFTPLWMLAALSIGAFEEWAFRGYLQFTLGSAIGFWPAALLISPLFGLFHAFAPFGLKWPVIILAALFGLFFCLTLRRTGSLWFAVGAHAAFDFVGNFFFGSAAAPEAVRGHLLNFSITGPDWLTGSGSFPTGGVQSLILWPLIALAFHFTHRNEPRPS